MLLLIFKFNTNYASLNLKFSPFLIACICYSVRKQLSCNSINNETSQLLYAYIIALLSSKEHHEYWGKP